MSDHALKQNENAQRYFLSFGATSFGYMVPWTALGSLISYYKHIYGPRFYVMVYCLYYLPGLPVALFQHTYVDVIDTLWGSQVAYLCRGLLAYSVMASVLIGMMWATDEAYLLFGFLLLGISGWLCHGTASMLAAMYPAKAIVSLQIGFRAPEVYAVIAVATLGLKSAANTENLQWFYGITALLVLAAMVTWTRLVLSSTSERYFKAKDSKLHPGKSRSKEARAVSWCGLRYDTLENSEKRKVSDCDSPDPTDPDDSGLGVNDDEALLGQHTDSNIDLDEMDCEAHGDGVELASYGDGTRSFSPRVGKRHPADNHYNGESAADLPEQHTHRPSLGQSTLSTLCVALGVSIWSSIFHAAFFAYVSSAQDESIEQTLYFVRLFADLLGRPMTLLPRPGFVRTSAQLLALAAVRACSLVLFFGYIFIPSIPRSDTFLLAFETVFSMVAGYTTVLVYEYAAAQGRTKAERARSASTLNMCFQLAAFTAVIMSVAISSYLSKAG